MSKAINLDGFGVFGIIGGVISIGFAAYKAYKLNKIAEKMDTTLKSLETKTAVDVEQDVVDTAVKNAVDRKVNRIAAEAVQDVRNDFHTQITNAVKKEVDEQYSKVADEVAVKVSEQVQALSEQKLVDKVLPMVKTELVRKGDAMLEDIRRDVQSRCNTNLSKTFDLINSVENIVTSKFNRGNGNGNGFSVNFGN